DRLPPAFGRAAAGLGLLGRGRGHPAPLLSRGEGRRRQEHAELEPRRRVRGRAEEGTGRDAVAATPQGADSVTIAISGGTPNRTGSRLVPMPELTKSARPPSTISPYA